MHSLACCLYSFSCQLEINIDGQDITVAEIRRPRSPSQSCAVVLCIRPAATRDIIGRAIWEIVQRWVLMTGSAECMVTMFDDDNAEDAEIKALLPVSPCKATIDMLLAEMYDMGVLDDRTWNDQYLCVNVL
jgi:hypothetical protein